MGSMRERAAAATRYLRDIADTAEAVADCVVQAGVLLRRILGSAGRLVRGLVDTLRVLINGAGRIAIDVIRLVATFRELLAVFSADSRRRYRRAYRAEENEIRRQTRDRARAAVEEERAHRRGASPPLAPHLHRRHRRWQESDSPSTSSGYPSTASEDSRSSSSSSSSSYFSMDDEL